MVLLAVYPSRTGACPLVVESHNLAWGKRGSSARATGSDGVETLSSAPVRGMNVIEYMVMSYW